MADLRRFLPAVSLSAVLAVAAPSAPAGDGTPDGSVSRPSPGIFGIHVENDIFAGTDRGYTNGFKLVWISPEIGSGPGRILPPGFLGRLARGLPFHGKRESRRFMSLSFGQNIFTPGDITRPELIPDDRPYAGFTYAGLGFHARSPAVLDGFEAVVGLVGPGSLSGDVQKFLHRSFGWTRPEGWRNQLKNELVLGLSAERKWKVRRHPRGPGWGWDAFVKAGARLSNAVTAAGSGLEIRAGRNLSEDFGSSFILPGGGGVRIRDGHEGRATAEYAGFHVFAVIEAQAVARDLFLDGNTFRESHRVVKEPLVADMALGAVFRKGAAEASFAYVIRSRRFVGQTYREIFGAFAFSLNL